MLSRHFKKELSAYCLGELNSATSQIIEQHLSACSKCRLELQRIRKITQIVGSITTVKAPDNLWAQLEKKISDTESFRIKESISLIPSLVLASALVCIVLVGWWWTAGIKSKPVNEVVTTASDPSINSQIVTNDHHSTNPTPSAIASSTPANNKLLKGESPKSAWNVEISDGVAIIGGIEREDNGKLGVGEWLETDSVARAKIDVADIGYVEVDPRSRLRLANSRQDEHRLNLTQGKISALIFAPPRLFIVDTPSARAVDLGCAYTLEVDGAGNTILEVTAGWVALERDGLESFIPAGAMCKTFKGQGIGTPYFANSSAQFISALNEIDQYGIESSERLSKLLSVASREDAISLWHLLAQLNSNSKFSKWRGEIFDRLSQLAPPPPSVTRQKILRGNKPSIQKWWTDVISGYEGGEYFWNK